MPRTDPGAVRDELDDHYDGVDTTSYPDAEADTDISRANHVVNNRIGDRVDDESLLTEIETLVAAHFAAPTFAKSFTDGRQVSQIQQGSRSATFADGDSGPGGYASPFWSQALLLDPSGRLGVQTRGVNTIAVSPEDECTN